MKTRIITGIIALVVFIPVLFFSHTLVFDVAIAVISAMGTFELLKCVGVVKKYALSAPAVTLAFGAPLTVRVVDADPEILMFIGVAYLFYLLFAGVFNRKKYTTNELALAFFATVFVTISFSSIIITRNLQNGSILYLLIFIGAWSSDTFAYFTGKLFGRRKFFPDISPNKTVEGAVGGVVFCSLAFVLYGFIISRIDNFDVAPNYILLAGVGLAVSVAAILGDLATSAIKRNYGVKDYGSIFPGHGGVMDRFDSVMATAPMIMIIGSVLDRFDGIGLFG